MCKEVFYISPFNSELTAAIIGQSLAPAILAGTWGVIGAAFLQNNEVHRDAASAFQHPDKAKVRRFWHPENSLLLWCALASPCWDPQLLFPWQELLFPSQVWGVNGASSYLLRCTCNTFFLLYRKKVLHVSLHALSVSFWPKTYHHWITAACSLVPGSCRGIGKSVPASLPSPAWTDEAGHSCPSKQ